MKSKYQTFFADLMDDQVIQTDNPAGRIFYSHYVDADPIISGAQTIEFPPCLKKSHWRQFPLKLIKQNGLIFYHNVSITLMSNSLRYWDVDLAVLVESIFGRSIE